MKVEASTARGLALPEETKGISRWMMVAAVVLLAVSAYLAYTRLYHPAPPPAKPQTAAVAKGTVAAAVTAIGSVASQATSRLAFKSAGNSSGVVSQLLASVGDQVKQGQVLAKLEDGDLKAQVAQAEAQLASTMARLDGLKAGARPEEVANAEAAMTSARARLSQVQAGATASDLQVAESAAATARNNAAELPTVSGVAPEAYGMGQVVAGPMNTRTRITGTTPDYERVRNFHAALGEFFNQQQVDSRAMVAVLGSQTARNLIGDVSPVGQNVRITSAMTGAGFSFRIIGVMESKGSQASGNQDDVVYMPITTLQQRLFSQRTAGGGGVFTAAPPPGAIIGG